MLKWAKFFHAQTREDAIRDYNWQMKTNFRRGVREGMERGIAQGMERGMAQGMERGVMQGLQILIETLKDLEQTEEEVCQKIMERYDLKLEEAQNYIKKFWKKD